MQDVLGNDCKKFVVYHKTSHKAVFIFFLHQIGVALLSDCRKTS